MSRISIIFYVLIVVVTATQAVHAAPAISSVSGTVSHGQSITISGSSFGTKSTAGPALYDSFDSGTVGNTICNGAGSGVTPQIYQGVLSSYSQWIMDGGGDYSSKSITFNGTSPLRTGSMHARAYIDTSACYGLNLYVPTAWYNAAGKELYVSFYLRTASSGLPRQSKALIGYDSNWADTFYMSTAYGTSCESSTQYRAHISQPTKESYFSTTGPQVNGEWIRCENYLKQSNAGTADGVWYSYLHRPTLSTPVIDSRLQNAVALRSSSTNTTKITLSGAYYSMCNGTQPANIDVDEVYIDNTPARVEIGNASTWSTCTRRVLQVTTAWSGTSITATVNQGTFPDNATGYVYVVAPDGSVNATGKEITFGASGGSVVTAAGGTMSGGGTLR